MEAVNKTFLFRSPILFVQIIKHSQTQGRRVRVFIPSKTQRSCVLEEIRYEKDWRHYLCHGFHFFVLHHTFCTSDNTNTQHTVVRFVQRSGGSGQQNIPFSFPYFVCPDHQTFTDTRTSSTRIFAGASDVGWQKKHTTNPPPPRVSSDLTCLKYRKCVGLGGAYTHTYTYVHTTQGKPHKRVSHIRHPMRNTRRSPGAVAGNHLLFRPTETLGSYFLYHTGCVFTKKFTPVQIRSLLVFCL